MRELRVLIVDDDVVLASVLAKMLERRGCWVDTHASGFGLSLAVRSARPDIVILDVQMPGLSGLHAMKALQALNERYNMPTPKILLHSGSDEQTLADLAPAIKAEAWIVKSSDQRAVVDRVLELARADRPEDSADLDPTHKVSR